MSPYEGNVIKEQLRIMTSYQHGPGKCFNTKETLGPIVSYGNWGRGAESLKHEERALKQRKGEEGLESF